MFSASTPLLHVGHNHYTKKYLEGLPFGDPWEEEAFAEGREKIGSGGGDKFQREFLAWNGCVTPEKRIAYQV